MCVSTYTDKILLYLNNKNNNAKNQFESLTECDFKNIPEAKRKRYLNYIYLIDKQ